MQKEQNYKRPLIGQILLDGGFLSHQDLKRALEQQTMTNELLGQVLVRMGILEPSDIKVALSVQSHLGNMEDAVKLAAGVRKKLGELLVQAGCVTESQIEQALAEQKKSGEKLGEIFVRHGVLTEKQLNCFLDFQNMQSKESPFPNPLRLGEILVSAGYISRVQLNEALRRQPLSRIQLGEVLIKEGYAQPHHIKRGIILQQMLLTAVLASFLTACGSGGGDNSVNTVNTDNTNPTTVERKAAADSLDYFEITGEDFNILKPSFYYSTDNEKFWSIQAAMAKSIWDVNYRCIVRIDIQKSDTSEMPDINKTFSIEENPLYEQFPGSFLVFNGEQSTNNKVERGIISFTPDSKIPGFVQGVYDVIMTDYDSGIVPAPQHHLTGSFKFTQEPSVNKL